MKEPLRGESYDEWQARSLLYSEAISKKQLDKISTRFYLDRDEFEKKVEEKKDEL